MNERERHSVDETQVEAPKALREDLRALFGRGPDVPGERDEAVRAMAQKRLTAKRSVLRWLWPVAAAAAMVLIVMWPRPIAHHEWPVPAGTPAAAPSAEPRAATVHDAPATAERGDVDDSGRVDILDAFALARRIEKGETLKPEWDVNRDGRVDGDDVDAIAKSAVSLSRGPAPHERKGGIR